MRTTDFDAEQWLDTMSALLDLPVADSYRQAVIANLNSSAQMATLLMAFELPDDLEAAPVFKP